MNSDPMTPEQKQLVTQTLRSILDAAILSSLWQLPVWARFVLGVAALGMLFYILS